MCNLFYFLEDFDIASYSDGTTVYKNKESIIATLETSSETLLNGLVAISWNTNNDKSHLLMSCTKPSGAITEDSCMIQSQKQLLLGVTIYSELKFDDHINYFCKKAGRKLNALVWIAIFMDTNKWKTIMKAFV